MKMAEGEDMTEGEVMAVARGMKNGVRNDRRT